MEANYKIAVFISVTFICFMAGIVIPSWADYLYQFTNLFFCILVFFIGTFVKTSNLVTCINNKYKIITLTILLRLVYVPFAAFLYSYVFQLNNEFSIGFIYLGIVPSAMIATVFSRIFNGDMTINILATFIMLILSPITIPILSVIYLDHFIEINFINMFTKLMLVVVVPLLAGIMSGKYIHKNDRKLNIITIDIATTIAVGLIILGITGHNSKIILSLQTMKLLAAITVFYITIFTIAVYLVQHCFLSSDNKTIRAIRNELSLSDCALSSTLSSYTSAVSTIPSAVAAVWQIICIATLNVIADQHISVKKEIRNEQ